jgi:hypothetical protein
LAWKLAHVLRRGATTRLLDTFDSERRPVISATLDQALARLKRWFKDLGGRLPETVEIVPDYDVVFGQRYTRGAILTEPDTDQAPFVAHASLSGTPGTRAPHRLITQGGKQRSTLDLFDRDLVLLVARGSAWQAAAQPLFAGPTKLRCEALDDLAPFGVEYDGAALVRPDGFVAWRSRSRPTDPAATLRSVCEALGFI